MPKAYPVYDDHYERNIVRIRPNVHPVGRNGLHRYNNQDLSMLTALLTVSNILDGAAHGVWG
jgi:UDP-galactopyranose mutase